MVQSKDGAKHGWCKARMVQNKDAEGNNGTNQGWCKARMAQSKDDAAQQGGYEAGLM